MDNKIICTCGITGKICNEVNIIENGENFKPCNVNCKIGLEWLKENNGLILHDEK